MFRFFECPLDIIMFCGWAPFASQLKFVVSCFDGSFACFGLADCVSLAIRNLDVSPFHKFHFGFIVLSLFLLWLFLIHEFTSKKVWLETKILLCFWHIKKMWHKQTCVKVRNVDLQAQVLKNMGCIMHDITIVVLEIPLVLLVFWFFKFHLRHVS